MDDGRVGSISVFELKRELRRNPVKLTSADHKTKN